MLTFFSNWADLQLLYTQLNYFPFQFAKSTLCSKCLNGAKTETPEPCTPGCKVQCLNSQYQHLKWDNTVLLVLTLRLQGETRNVLYQIWNKTSKSHLTLTGVSIHATFLQLPKTFVLESPFSHIPRHTKLRPRFYTYEILSISVFQSWKGMMCL